MKLLIINCLFLLMAKKPSKRASKAHKPKRKPAKRPAKRKPEPKKKPKAAKRSRPKKPEAVPGPPSALPKEKSVGLSIAPPLYPREPQPLPPPKPGLSPEITINLDTLPAWEDRLRLRRTMFEDGLKFYLVGKGSPESEQASSLLSSCKKDSQPKKPGYFMVCAKGRDGKIAGAMDGHALEGGIVSICRSYAKDRKIRDLHILLYAAALTGRGAKYAVFSTAVCPLSYELAGKLILLGRGFGMSALPIDHPKSIFFIRKVGNELEPSASGEELADVLRTLVLLEPSLAHKAGELAQQESVTLISLPLSPDSREHLHELRELADSLHLEGETKSVLDDLRDDYIVARKDVTPESLF